MGCCGSTDAEDETGDGLLPDSPGRTTTAAVAALAMNSPAGADVKARPSATDETGATADSKRSTTSGAHPPASPADSDVKSVVPAAGRIGVMIGRDKRKRFEDVMLRLLPVKTRAVEIDLTLDAKAMLSHAPTESWRGRPPGGTTHSPA
jgi:hypothetical protein